ncbi:MAG: hypothetical protein M1816_005762 [Peltula sp. TS41687]|nr:MAG: hypothetical protein M1816_005762 [Peltula sp. TS41687]
MSSAPTEGQGSSDRPSGGGDRRQSFNKFMTRAKSALKREKTKRHSSSGDLGSTNTTPISSPPLAPPAEVSELGPTDKGKKPEAKPTVEKKAASAATSRAAIQQEKARALFEKYGLTLEPHEWPVPTVKEPVERVQKPIRMRIHRQCHRCQTTFGPEKVCTQCEHKRCKKCPRYPVKKAKHGLQDHGKVAGISVGAGAPTTAAPETDKAKATAKYRYVIPAKAEQQDRVRKDVKQRVHRTCHKCSRTFLSKEKVCSGCNHLRCTKCPRDPPKLDKYPNGYPGDAQPDDESPDLISKQQRTYKKVRMAVKWYCHNCNQVFIQGTKVCGSCEHDRCADCRRVPPKKVKSPPTFDPEVMKSMEAKLAAMSLEIKKDSGQTGETGDGSGQLATATTSGPSGREQ